MVIVVVGAMIYMFQTFGGTGDKIEGIAQKTSVITEINNIKNGLKLAARNANIAATENTTKETAPVKTTIFFIFSFEAISRYSLYLFILFSSKAIL